MNIAMSVRSLVEFLYRWGDIDSTKGYSSEDAMAVGARIHRKIQSLAGPSYRAEYSLSYSYETKYCNVTVEGRADGVITEETPPEYLLEDTASTDGSGNEQPADALMLPAACEKYVTIDEIKTVLRSLDFVKEPDPVHLAQAKCYAAIYAMMEDLPFIYVRMTYVNQQTENIKYFYFLYSAEEIKKWFFDTTSAMGEWLDIQAEWNLIRQASIEELEFPFPYRPGQKNLAQDVYRTIYHGKKLFIEAPTGTGKTLSVLFPAVKSMGEKRGDRIFYLTARTVARTVAEDAVTILKDHGLRFKNITLTAKEKICFMDEAKCDPKTCPYAKGHFDRVNECLFEMVSQEETYSRTVIEEYAQKYTVCPFELALDLSLFSDCIIGDYNYVFDPKAYLRRFFAAERGEDYIFLIDEAHNLVDRGREMYSAALVKEDFLAARRACSQYQPRIGRAMDKCNKDLLAIRKLRDTSDDRKLCLMPALGDIVAHADRLRLLISEYLSEHRDGPAHEEILDIYFKVCDFLNIYDLMGPDYCIYNSFDDKGDFFVKLMCVDPARNLKECMGHAISTILFSATLLPIKYYKSLLGGESNDYEVYAQSSFDRSNRLLIRASDVTTRYAQRGEDQYRRMARYISSITRAKRGNYIIFAPSYSYMNSVYEIYEREFHDMDAGEVIVQSGNMREWEREEFLDRFKNGNDGIIAFCVLGGIFAEGIDLRDEALIGVIVLGTGLPQIGGEKDLLRMFFDMNGQDGYDYAYTYPGMNKVQQAAGRLIRTETDRGVIALLDERFSWNKISRMFPREWNDIVTVNIDNVESAVEAFWKKWYY